MRGPHTQSAETGEVARRSGGDLMPVDDAYALENTLARLRQRYALYFNVPPDAKPGEQRNIELALAESAHRRFPEADVRYRRVYLAPSGGARTVAAQAASSPPVGNTPVEKAEQATVLKPRRPGVSQDGPRQGPLEGMAGPSSDAQSGVAAPPQHSARHIDEPLQQTGPIEPRCGGWHRVDEPAPPPCPSDANNTRQDRSKQN
jgi:hypothetical protein